MDKIRQWIESAEEIIAKLSAAGQPGVCKFAQGDVEGCEAPDFDDAAWKPVMGKGAPINGINVNSGDVGPSEETLDLCDWSMAQGPAAMRKVFSLPGEIEGIPTEGTKVYLTMTMLAPVEVYVDGGLAAAYRYWGDSRHCEITVTGSYRRGATHVLVFKTPENDGDAHLGVYINNEELERRMLDLSAATAQLRFLGRLKALAPGRVAGVAERLDASLHPSGLLGRDWGLIDSDLRLIDEALLEIDDLAKTFRVHLVAHAHIDLNWLWDMEDTKEICVRDFRTIVGMMDENPDLCFSQSQAAVYDIVRREDPETFARVLEKIKEGRWEVTAATWTEHDLYTSGDEVFANQLLQSYRFLGDALGAGFPRVCWEPDTFGHPATVPNVLAKAGVRYYYHFRCNNSGHALKWWEGTDGSRLLDFCFGPYNNALRPANIMPVVEEFFDAYGVRVSMFVFGVGDHGGGPARRDIAVKRFLDKKPGLPRLVFSRACDFFDEALAAKADWPVHAGEQDFIFEGTYTTKSKTKNYLRAGESRLKDAQAAAALALASGAGAEAIAAANKTFDSAWRSVCFNGFHDIACGCNIKAADAYTFQIGEEALRAAEGILPSLLGVEEGDGVAVFNPLSFERTDIAVAAAPGQPDGAVRVRWDGGEAPGQVCGGALHFTASGVPGLSVRNYTVEAAGAAEPPMPLSIARGIEDGSVLRCESARYVLEIGARTGTVVRLYDKLEDVDVLKPAVGYTEVPGAYFAQRSSGLLKAQIEEPHIMSAWALGNEKECYFLIDTPEIEVVQNGAVFTRFRISRSWRASRFTQLVTLYRDLPRVDFDFLLDWQELGDCRAGVPVLKMGFTAGIEAPRYIYEAPFGSVERTEQNAERPAYRYAALCGDGRALALFNDNKHGFSVSGGQVFATLVRGSYSPDAAPDKGEVSGRIAIRPYSGEARRADFLRGAMEVNQPLAGLWGRAPEAGLALGSSRDNVVITSVKPSCDGEGLVVTAQEAEGRPARARLLFPKNTERACEADLLQRPLRELALEGGAATVAFAPYEIKSFKCR
ncbi:MAG: hypothetical protein LBR44_09435 [Clostridiales Family XIII bacterium]|jgi:alpha-mannosidase|nr:hypothetical protein [Clostridiales Family XIII bacterium]